MSIKHLIWTNDVPNSKDMEGYRARAAELREKPVSEVTDDEMWQEFNRDTDDLWHCEKENLDRPLDGRVLVIASLGLWSGRKTGYRLTESTNLNAVLEGFCGDFVTVGSDGHNIIASDAHHDGTNYYTFREVREDRNIDVLLDKLYSGTATNSDINRYTRSLERKARSVYGW